MSLSAIGVVPLDAFNLRLDELALLAGMPTLTLTEITRLRVQTLSFFAMGVLAAAAAVRWLWHGLRRDFPRLPDLSYRGALCGTILWGLLFLFVLAMISGARELLTPGAWEKVGVTYRLAGSDPTTGTADDGTASVVTLEQRRSALEKLGSALLLHAARHDGQFPSQCDDVNAAVEVWDQPGYPGTRYDFLPGLTAAQPATVIAFEQQLYGHGSQLVLWTDGTVEEMSERARAEILAHR